MKENKYDADMDTNSDDDNKYCVKNKKSKQSKKMKRIIKKTNKNIYKINDLLNKLKL
jgi:Txe/YoeB family toxin of Txe-Axe toxin-antitoxin module